MADGAAIAPASPPPTPHGVDFFSNTNEILKVVGGGGYNWVHTIISIFDAGVLGLAALKPPASKIERRDLRRCEFDKKKYEGKADGSLFLFFLINDERLKYILFNISVN